MANVLVVEPDKNLASILEKFLARSFNVALCLESQKAISAADGAQPDIVVLELALPEHNGLAFLQEFKTYTDWIDIPVIVYSHIPVEDTGLSLAEWKKQGVNAYLYKSTTSLATLKNNINYLLAENETA